MTTTYTADVGPVLMTAANDRYTETCRIGAIVWQGSGTAGDTVTLQCPETGAILYKGRALDTNYYLGLSYGTKGIPAPYGFKVAQISSGEVYVYLRED